MKQITATDFLRALYGDLRAGETIELRLKHRDETSCVHFTTIENAAGAAARAASEADVFFGVALRDGNGGRKRNITRITTAWADIDAGDDLVRPLQKLSRTPLRPSAVVYSGRGLHCYWFLAQHVGADRADDIERLNKLIAAAVQGDSVHDAARVLRVPDTLNWKYGEPLEVHMMGMRPERRYSIEHMFSSFTPEQPENAEVAPAAPAATSRERSASAHDSLPCRAAMWAGVSEGRRNGACFQLVVDLKRQGLPEQLALAALLNWNMNNRPPMSTQELENTVASVYSGGYTGLGCEKEPMRSLCAQDCPVAVGGMHSSPRRAPEGVYVSGFDDDQARQLSAPRNPQAPACQVVRESLPPEEACWRPAELARAASSPQEFVVERLVPARGVTMLSGEGGLGKSFVALEMACACASADRFLGRFECRQGPVLIVDVENDEALLGRRIAKVAAGRGLALEDLEVRITRGSEAREMMQIDSLEGRQWLGRLIEHYRPALVVVDSMVGIHSQDENNNVAMRQVMRWLDDFARGCDLGLVLVHHHRKRGMYNESSQMMRGASDIRNATVSHIAMKRSGQSRMIVEQDKCRCGEALPSFIIEISDNEERTQTYVRYVADAGSSPGSTKTGQARELVLDLLSESEVCEFRELAEKGSEAGVRRHVVRDAIDLLLQEGRITKTGRGRYALSASLMDLGGAG